MTSAPITWHDMEVQQVFAELGSSRFGLGTGSATTRLAAYGPNILPSGKGGGVAALVGRQVRNPLALVLLGSSALTFSLGQPTEAAVVLAAVVLNAAIGALQEYRTVRAIAALDSLVPENVTVLRDTYLQRVRSSDVVPGDVVSIEAGDRVPADLRVFTQHNLRVNEASLTGEPIPVVKRAKPVPRETGLSDRVSMAFSGTFVVSGTARGVAVATGTATELGHISTLLHGVKKPETPLTRKLRGLNELITWIIGLAAFVIFHVAHRRGFPLLDAIRSGVVFACAAIPEGLPAVITITLAVAVRRMAARNAVVRTLPSVETLGSTTVICSDKTGTLTRGEMTVRRVCTHLDLYELSGAGYVPIGEIRHGGVPMSRPPRAVVACLNAAALCNDAVIKPLDDTWIGIGDPTEVALVVAAEKIGLSVADVRARWPRTDAIPFDASRRYMATLHDDVGSGQRVVLKGAPEVVLRHCTHAAGEVRLDRKRVSEMIDLLASNGMRVLAVASIRPPRHLDELSPDDLSSATLLGLMGLVDPPRPEAVDAIATCHRAGIRIKMATGDHPATAQAIGAELGLALEGHPVVTGFDIVKSSQSDLERLAEDAAVFARVQPDHKLRLVEALQARGEIVAMTGDGVNDAPALKQADVGVAMGEGGTATAREAANIVLVDNNFTSIAAAVEEGRRCYANLIKSLLFLIPTNLGQSLVVLCGVLFFPVVDGVPLTPLVPVQVLWVNLVTGVTLALPLAFEGPEPDLLRQPPRRSDRPMFDVELVVRTVLVGSLIAAGGVGLFLSEYFFARFEQVAAGLALRRAQTMTATTVVLFQAFYLFQCRSLATSTLRRGWFSNRAVWFGVLATIAFQAAFVHVRPMNVLFGSAPLTASDWALSTLVAGTVAPVVALMKLISRRRKHPANSAQM